MGLRTFVFLKSLLSHNRAGSCDTAMPRSHFLRATEIRFTIELLYPLLRGIFISFGYYSIFSPLYFIFKTGCT
jgi:hypothetical protein